MRLLQESVAPVYLLAEGKNKVMLHGAWCLKRPPFAAVVRAADQHGVWSGGSSRGLAEGVVSRQALRCTDSG